MELPHWALLNNVHEKYCVVWVPVKSNFLVWMSLSPGVCLGFICLRWGQYFKYCTRSRSWNLVQNLNYHIFLLNAPSNAATCSWSVSQQAARSEPWHSLLNVVQEKIHDIRAHSMSAPDMWAGLRHLNTYLIWAHQSTSSMHGVNMSTSLIHGTATLVQAGTFNWKIDNTMHYSAH